MKIKYLFLFITVLFISENSQAYEEIFMPDISSTIYKINRIEEINCHLITHNGKTVVFKANKSYHGTGFMASPNGLLLTASHVAIGEASMKNYVRDYIKRENKQLLKLLFKYKISEVYSITYRYIIEDYWGRKYYLRLSFNSLGGCLSLDNTKHEIKVGERSNFQIQKESFPHDLALLKLNVERRPYLLFGS